MVFFLVVMVFLWVGWVVGRMAVFDLLLSHKRGFVRILFVLDSKIVRVVVCCLLIFSCLGVLGIEECSTFC